MSITGVGSQYTYMYDAATNKLSTKDGSADKFCDFFNGDLAEKDYGELNGYDMKMKKDIESMIMLFNSDVQGAHVFNPDEGLYEISTEIVQGDTAKYTVNGKHAFTGCVGMQYTKSELKAFTDLQQSYRTTNPQRYNAADNSMNIAIGDIYNIGNGRKIVVENNWMHGIGFSNNNEEINEFNKYLDGLNALMRVGMGKIAAGDVEIHLSGDGRKGVDDRTVGEVPLAREREGAVEHDAEAGRRGVALRKFRGGACRAHGVRARRPPPDLI